MGKHSRHSNTREFFTSGEREKASRLYGSAHARLGADSQRRFDECQLCLGRLVEPTATPAGFLYCRECILKNLLQQKQMLDAARREYAAQADGDAAAEAARAVATATARVSAFERLEQGVLENGGGGSSGAVASSSSSAGAPRALSAAELMHLRATERIDPRTAREKREEAESSSFWAPAAAPSAAATRLKAPDAHPRDPCGGDFLRVKQLIAVRLTKAPEETLGGGGSASSIAAAAAALSGVGSGAGDDHGRSSAEARFICPGCLRGITSQQMHLFAPCGHALCDACVKRFVDATMRCHECNHALTGKDVIKLMQGGTGRLGHAGTVAEAKKWTPSLIS